MTAPTDELRAAFEKAASDYLTNFTRTAYGPYASAEVELCWSMFLAGAKSREARAEQQKHCATCWIALAAPRHHSADGSKWFCHACCPACSPGAFDP